VIDVVVAALVPRNHPRPDDIHFCLLPAHLYTRHRLQYSHTADVSTTTAAEIATQRLHADINPSPPTHPQPPRHQRSICLAWLNTLSRPHGTPLNTRLAYRRRMGL
jgi:hypothetical protein